MEWALFVGSEKVFPQMASSINRSWLCMMMGAAKPCMNLKIQAEARGSFEADEQSL